MKIDYQAAASIDSLSRMPLYHVQDSDRPMWVIANDYGDAVDSWKKFVAQENDMSYLEVEEPRGVQFICDRDDLIPLAEPKRHTPVAR
jgi:hypothetical protein